MPAMDTIAVIGGGAWGTALAEAAARAGRKVILWAREDEVVQAINSDHCNRVFLPDAPLNPAILATTNLAAIMDADAVLAVAPAQHMRTVTAQMAPYIEPGTPVVICAKGIEQQSGQLMSDVLADTLPKAVPAVLTGPTFAIEVARGLPAAVTLACADEKLGVALMHGLGAPTFRPYYSDDIIGAQIGGAVKNVLAIACGIATGLDLGENARAALITRGMAEILRFGLALGAKRDTLMGLSGLGDLILTCSSPASRNMSLGLALGQGKTIAQIMDGRKTVAEGFHTSSALITLAQSRKVEMPIAEAVDALLNKGAQLEDTIRSLLARPFTTET